MILLLIFLPGTWICYGLSRWGLHFFQSLPQEDQLILSVLAAAVYLLSSLMRMWEIWRRTGNE